MPLPNKTLHTPSNKVTAMTKFSHDRQHSIEKARDLGAALDAIAKATGKPRLQLDSPLGRLLVKRFDATSPKPADVKADNERAAVVALCNRVIATGKSR